MSANTLRSRLIRFIIAMLLPLSVIFSLTAWLSATDHIHEQIDSNLKVAKNTLRQLLTIREQQLVHSADVLTADIRFENAVAARDETTIERVLQNHAERIKADLVLLLSLKGEVIGADSFEWSLSSQKDYFLRSNQDQGGTIQYLRFENRLYQVILVPVTPPNPTAIALIGFELNSALALRWKGLTQLDISFLANPSDSNQILVSTLPTEQKQTVLQETNAFDKSISSFYWDRPAFSSLRFKVNEVEAERIEIALSYPVNKAFQAFDQLQLKLFFTTLAIAFLALLSGTVAAKKLSNTLKEFAAMASEMPRGDFHLKINTPNNTKEVNELATAFNVMQIGLSEREARIIHQSQHDPLTNLINRQHIISLLQDELNHPTEKSTAVICINILDFKIVNDTFGHSIGDQCLQQISQRLQKFTEHQGLAARLGGDEFLLITPLNRSIEKTAENIFTTLQQPYLIYELEIALSFSMGAASSPKDGSNADDLIQKASIALDTARREQLGIAFYEKNLEETHIKRLKLLADLKTTLADDQNHLQMYFQPKIHSNDPAQFRFEALIRWVHPEQGFIPPDLFIPLAEQAGLIASITDWVVKAVIEQIAQWKQHNFHAQVAINLSAKDLTRKHLLKMINQLLQQHELPSDCLAFEITESEIMRDAGQAIELLSGFRNMGFDLAIDDFGTGYSSLSQLKLFPVTELKIDKSFVLDLNNLEDDQIIVQSTINLAHSFNLKVVAEGVENQASLDLLRQWGCDWIQGFYISRPIPAKDVLDWVDSYADTARSAQS